MLKLLQVAEIRFWSTMLIAMVLSDFALPAAGAGVLEITMKRVAALETVALLKIHNPTKKHWCLVPVSFSSSQFILIVRGKKAINRAPHFNLSTKCLDIGPGATISREIPLTAAFTEDELRQGKLCYTFAYTPLSKSDNARAMLGTLCEPAARPPSK
jgi:hypothetical protein